MHKYCKIVKRRNLSNRNTSIDIEQFSRDGSFKPKLQTEILQNSEDEEFTNQDYRQTYYKIPKRHGCFLTQHILSNVIQLRMSRGRIRKSSASPGRTYVHIRFQRWLEPMILLMKIISNTNQQWRPFKEEEDTVPQRLELCAPVLLTWDPQLEPRWKMGSVNSSISGARPLMCLTKPFLS